MRKDACTTCLVIPVRQPELFIAHGTLHRALATLLESFRAPLLWEIWNGGANVTSAPKNILTARLRVQVLPVTRKMFWKSCLTVPRTISPGITSRPHCKARTQQNRPLRIMETNLL